MNTRKFRRALDRGLVRMDPTGRLYFVSKHATARAQRFHARHKKA